MEKVLLGARLPKPIVGELKKFCRTHGLKMSHLISEAIREKLEELKEDEERKEISLPHKKGKV